MRSGRADPSTASPGETRVPLSPESISTDDIIERMRRSPSPRSGRSVSVSQPPGVGDGDEHRRVLELGTHGERRRVVGSLRMLDGVRARLPGREHDVVGLGLRDRCLLEPHAEGVAHEVERPGSLGKSRSSGFGATARSRTASTAMSSRRPPSRPRPRGRDPRAAPGPPGASSTARRRRSRPSSIDSVRALDEAVRVEDDGRADRKLDRLLAVAGLVPVPSGRPRPPSTYRAPVRRTRRAAAVAGGREPADAGVRIEHGVEDGRERGLGDLLGQPVEAGDRGRRLHLVERERAQCVAELGHRGRGLDALADDVAHGEPQPAGGEEMASNQSPPTSTSSVPGR